MCALDGTPMCCPDAPANLRVFCKGGTYHGGTGYPMIRLVALVACGTRTIIDAVFGPTGTGETGYAPGLLGALRGMILLGDRNFAANSCHRDRRHRRRPADPHQVRAAPAGLSPIARRQLPVPDRVGRGPGHPRRDHHHHQRGATHGSTGW